MIRLDLGCCDRSEDGWTGVDVRHPADVIHDLNVYPWPFADGSVDAIRARGVLEHLSCDYMDAIREMHRILRVGGELEIWVPHCMGPGAFRWEHRHQFSRMSFTEICNGETRYAQPIPPMFDEVSYRAVVWDRPTIMDWLPSRYPIQWDRLGLLRPSEIRWIGRKKEAAL